ncbi:C4-dicarboxylate ABC transporter [Rhodococcus sp. CUA-806]|nr:C4-dicarboxylate ABC transporter [Rhodococcus sp. CUA-806]
MTAGTVGAAFEHKRTRLLSELERPGQLIEHITPNWFASVMGTGIVANAAATLPVHSAELRAFATVVWALASFALLALTVAFAAHWILHPANARRYAEHPVVSLFYGAPPMAMLTVGAGTLLLGKDVIGDTAALHIAATLWVLGTITGVATSVWMPYRMLRQGRSNALPAWLMPVVPPMVSATGGALLLPYIGDDGLRVWLLALCYALFALSLALGAAAMTLIYRDLLRGGGPTLQAAPTVWITLGLVGQSITAANLLGADAGLVLGSAHASLARDLHAFGIGYGLFVGVLAIGAVTVACTVTAKAMRNGLRFSLTWWSFTFPVGTCVTGATALGAALGLGVVSALAVVLYAALLSAWVVVAAHTVRGSISGRIFLP